MIFIVDTVSVDPREADDYMVTVRTAGVPVMKKAGAGFVSCMATSKDLGEEVLVQTVWSTADHVEWNEIRKNLVLDPDWYAYSARIAAVWRSGNRRFFYSDETPAAG